MRLIEVSASYFFTEDAPSENACLVGGDTGFFSFVDHDYNVMVPTDIPVSEVPGNALAYLLRGVEDERGNVILWSKDERSLQMPLLAIGTKA